MVKTPERLPDKEKVGKDNKHQSDPNRNFRPTLINVFCLYCYREASLEIVPLTLHHRHRAGCCITEAYLTL